MVTRFAPAKGINVKAPGAEIEGKVTDDYGNETRKTTDGNP